MPVVLGYGYSTNEGLAQGPYVTARVGLEPATLWMHCSSLFTKPLLPCFDLGWPSSAWFLLWWQALSS